MCAVILVHGAHDNTRVLVASLHLISPLILHPVPTCAVLSWRRHSEYRYTSKLGI